VILRGLGLVSDIWGDCQTYIDFGVFGASKTLSNANLLGRGK
jgi:hypothetical protein